MQKTSKHKNGGKLNLLSTLMNPLTSKSMSKLVTQPSFRGVGQTHEEWQTYEKHWKLETMYDWQWGLVDCSNAGGKHVPEQKYSSHFPVPTTVEEPRQCLLGQ